MHESVIDFRKTYHVLEEEKNWNRIRLSVESGIRSFLIKKILDDPDPKIRTGTITKLQGFNKKYVEYRLKFETPEGQEEKFKMKYKQSYEPIIDKEEPTYASYEPIIDKEEPTYAKRISETAKDPNLTIEEKIEVIELERLLKEMGESRFYTLLRLLKEAKPDDVEINIVFCAKG